MSKKQPENKLEVQAEKKIWKNVGKMLRKPSWKKGWKQVEKSKKKKLKKSWKINWKTTCHAPCVQLFFTPRKHCSMQFAVSTRDIQSAVKILNEFRLIWRRNSARYILLHFKTKIFSKNPVTVRGRPYQMTATQSRTIKWIVLIFIVRHEPRERNCLLLVWVLKGLGLGGIRLRMHTTIRIRNPEHHTESEWVSEWWSK